jgi:hypothetical protein
MPVKKYPYQNLSLKDIKGEEWKDIPGFEDYYQVSNYGRIKGLDRWVERQSIKRNLHLPEHILKQTIFKTLNPYTKQRYKRLRTSLYRNGQIKNIRPGRLVYYCFVEKFDLEEPTLVITPKNGDHLNTKYSNLLLVKKTEVQERTYKEGLKKRPFKKISQYDTNGHLIKTYNSIIDAGAETGFSLSRLSQAANGHLRHCGGWLWKFGTRKKIKAAVKLPYKHARRKT